MKGIDLVNRVLKLREAQVEQKNYGPFDVIYSSDLSGWMCSWYRQYCRPSREEGNITVKDRIGMIAGIEDVELNLDLPPNTIKMISIVFELPARLRT